MISKIRNQETGQSILAIPDVRKYLETSGLSLIDENNVTDRKLIKDEESKINENLSYKFGNLNILSYA